ncbi:MAG: hypothetical protein HW412_1913 [Bacteroidetes bacterium]|nr:hypothetical protein [Bacteroidota bacterium]
MSDSPGDFPTFSSKTLPVLLCLVVEKLEDPPAIHNLISAQFDLHKAERLKSFRRWQSS